MKQSRREPKTVKDSDLFEAEDSDPDEVKNASRYDEVENYEYELPSDFEDEEIDEELAFTEEDKKKYGSWFEREVSADGDDDGDAGAFDVDEEYNTDDFSEDDDAADGAKGGRKGPGQSKAAAAEADSDDPGEEDDDDDLPFEDDDDDEDNELEDLGEDDSADEEAHRAMLEEALAAAGAKGGLKKRRADPNAAVVSEAYPEAEFNLNPGAASAGGAGALKLSDLLAGLGGDAKKKLGAARKLLEKVGGAAGDRGVAPVSVPLPSVVAERQERKAGYEAAAKDVSKWTSIVKANREAPTLRLIAGREEVPRVDTTAAIVAQHTPSADNALEAEVAELLKAAGAQQAEAMQEAEEALALKELTLEEARERRQRLAKLRSLLFYHELKSRRLKSIKSKEYHRHLARAQKRKAAKLAAAAGEAGGEDNVDAERAAAIEAEFQRAKERLTLRHRNSSRWARRALKRGQLNMDTGTKAALADQLQLGQELKRKMEGRRGGGSDDDTDASDDDASTSASDGEGGEGGEAGEEGAKARPSAASGRLRSAALELLAGNGLPEGEAAPAKGLLALPFMKRALERRRLAAQQEAEQLLRDLEEQQHMQQQGSDGEDGDGDAADPDEAMARLLAPGPGAGGQGVSGLEQLVGYGAPGLGAGASGRRVFGGGRADGGAEEERDGESDEGEESDDMEDAEARAARLGRKTKQKVQQEKLTRQQQQGKGGKKGTAGQQAPTAEDHADLDAALAAGKAGQGLLVSSSDAGVDMDVGRGEARKAGAKGKAAGAGAAAAAVASGSGSGLLAEVAVQQGTVAGRAALFQTAAAADGEATGAAGKAAFFIAAKKFAGAKAGYFFKKGPQGLGYYLDKVAAAKAAKEAKAGAGVAGKGAAAPVVVAGQGAGKAGATHGSDANGHSKGKPKGGQGQAGAGAPEADAVEAGAGGGGDGDDSDEEAAPMMRPATQKDLIRAAFAGDDVEAEFAADKAAAVAEELPSIEEPSTLPGWGAWAGQQRNPKWMQTAKDKAAKQREAAAAGRKDAKLKYVVISEKYDKKAIKYTAPAAPFPFTSQEAYERSIRQPLGREYNPDAAFRDLTRPAVIKQSGVVIAPLRFSESTAKALAGQAGKGDKAKDRRPKVATVAGGMPRLGKQQ